MTPGDPTDAARFFTDVASRHRRAFWLDGGGEPDGSRRRSLVGWLDEDDVSLTYDAARRRVTRHSGGRADVVGDDVFHALEQELTAGSPSDQWVGYFGYAARPDLPARPDPLLPDAVWMRASHARHFEHGPLEGPGVPRESRPFSGEVSPEKGRNPRCTGDSDPAHPPPPAYATAFDRVQEQLHAGNSYEVNLTYRRDAAGPADPAATYLRLRHLNPAPYAGFVQHDLPGARAWLLSSSPERFATVTSDRVVETRPIKGTTPRGATPEEDAAQQHRLATDPKCRAENLMITDLLRHDLARVCEVGSVEVPSLMTVERYASVHQLVSTVRGRLRDEVSTVDALRTLFPAGSMTGAPKLRTMQVIDAVEETPRGVYAGAFGRVGGDGTADLGVVIRSLTTVGDGRYRLGTGGGVTVRSRLAEEWAESCWKAGRLLAALRHSDVS